MDPVTRRILISGAVGVAVLVASASSTIAQLILFGWFNFLSRTLPQYDLPWARGLAFGAGVAVFVWGCRRVLRRRPSAMFVDEPALPAPGRLPSVRGTVLACSIGLSLCLAGVALTGIAHQLHWLNSGREDVWEVRTAVRNFFILPVPRDEAAIRGRMGWYGDKTFVLLRDPAGRHRATLVVPCDPTSDTIALGEQSFTTVPRAELRSIIRAIESGRWPKQTNGRDKP